MKKDKTIGLIMLAVGACFSALTLQIKVPESSINIGEPGPRLFPMIGCALILFGSIGLMLQKGKAAEPFMTKGQVNRMVQLSGLFILYIGALYLLGFTVSTPIMLFVSMTMFAGNKKVPLWVKVIYSVLITAAIYLVFGKVLALALPKGLIVKKWRML